MSSTLINPHKVILSPLDIEGLVQLGNGVQPPHGFMYADWMCEALHDEVSAKGRVPLRLTTAGRAWLTERLLRVQNVDAARCEAMDETIRRAFTKPITAEEGIRRLLAGEVPTFLSDRKS